MSKAVSFVVALATICLLVALAYSQGNSGETYFPPPESQEGWRKNTDPEFIRSLGVDPASLDRWTQWNREQPANPAFMSTLVIKDGWIISEDYWLPHVQSSAVSLTSIGKTITLVLFGTVFVDAEKGYIPELSPESRLYDPRWLPQGFPLSDPGKAEIRISQVLNHTSGLCPQLQGCNKIKGKRNYMRADTPWTDYVSWLVGHEPERGRTVSLAYPPGHPEQLTRNPELLGYSSVGYGHLGLMLRNLYGQPATEILDARVLKPLGIEQVDYPDPPDPGLGWFMAAGFAMLPRDLARFAYLIANHGKWDNQQVVPNPWMTHIANGGEFQNYQTNQGGYIDPAYPEDLIRFYGRGGNMVVIVPSLGFIAIRTDQTRHVDEISLRNRSLTLLMEIIGSG